MALGCALLNGLCIQQAAAISAAARAAALSESELYSATAGACAAGAATNPVSGSVSTTQSQADNAKIIMGIAKSEGLSQDAAIIGIMVALDESTLTILANSNVPISESNPAKQGDGSNGDSVGVFQQQPQDGWSTYATGSAALSSQNAVYQDMDPAFSAEAFFGSPSGANLPSGLANPGALTKGLQNVSGWQSMTPWMAAQAVQGSATADGSNYEPFDGRAQSMVTQYWDSAPAVALPIPFTGGSAPAAGVGSASGCGNTNGCGGSSSTSLGSLPPGTTRDQTIAQTFVVGFPGSTDPSVIQAVVNQYHIGGIFITGTLGPGLNKQFFAQLSQAASTPLTIATDEEGGEVVRYPVSGGLPSAQQMGAMSNSQVTQYGAAAGQELSGEGVTTDLAPVLDLDAGSSLTSIQQRTFSSDPNTAAEKAGAFAQGLQSSGINVTFKHFPGFGGAGAYSSSTGAGDTDTNPVVVPSSYNLQKNVAPYATLLSKYPNASVMLSNLYIPSLTKNLPASLSPDAVNYLRNTMKFNGLITTDDLSALQQSAYAAAGKSVSLPNAIAQALQAGADAPLFTIGNSSSASGAEASIQADIDAVNGAVPTQTVNSAVSAVLASKNGPSSNTNGSSTTSSTPPTSSATAGLSSVRQQVVCIAQQQLALWQNNTMTPGFRPNSVNSFSTYSQNADELWCADFASWVYNQANDPLQANPSWKVGLVATIQSIGQGTSGNSGFHYHDAAGYTPKPGDLVIHLSGEQHVNMVVAVNGSSMDLIGGDQDPNSNGYPDGSRVSEYTDSGFSGTDGITGYVSPD